jgi:two-component system, OmpR family, response regulator
MRLLLITNDNDCKHCVKSQMGTDYIIDIENTGEKGTSTSEVNAYDAIIVDSVLPDIDGVEVCRMIRAANINTPIAFIAERNGVHDKVHSLDAGADAFVHKPLNISELAAEIRTLIRMKAAIIVLGNKIKLGILEIDISKKQAFVGEEIIKLRRKEYDLLEYLILNKDKIVPKEDILEHVWDQGIDVLSNTLEVHIKNLRDKLKECCIRNYIITVRGFGYTIKS